MAIRKNVKDLDSMAILLVLYRVQLDSSIAADNNLKWDNVEYVDGKVTTVEYDTFEDMKF